MTPRALARDGAAVLEAVRARPGGPELIDAATGRQDVALVGGAVRDLLLGREPRELDVALDGDALALAGELQERLGGSVRPHERFGTAVLEWPGGRVDIARRRAESYPAPGALPEVRPGSPEEDLARRDFTVNAIAVPLARSEGPALRCAEHALEDLAAGRLRVLHERSFLEDPTRLLRLARYSARLGFHVEQRTLQLSQRALREGALGSVSGARVGAELRLALGEADALGSLEAMSELGVLRALPGQPSIQRPLAQAALQLAPPDARPGVLLMACLLLARAREQPHELGPALEELEFAAGDRDRIMSAALNAGALAATLQSVQRPSLLHEALHRLPPEAVALAGAVGQERARESALRWLQRLREVRLEITGEDLLAAGLAPGPELGRRLQRALALKLDGQLAQPGRAGELRAALEERS